jgi:DNA polymerase (family 10)
VKNSEIIKILEDIADFLDLKGENVFKSRAYQKAARSIEFLSEDVEKLVKEDRLREIPGVGEAIAVKLTELVNTGHLQYYDNLRAEFPPGIGAFLGVPGIGPRTALLITRNLNVTTIDELEEAIKDGRVADLPRLGEKTAQNILRQIQAYRKKKNEQRVPLGTALPLAESILEALKDVTGLKNLTTAGSLRRFRDTIGDIDVVGTSDRPAEALDAFTTLPQVKEVLEKGAAKASVIVFNGIQVDLRLVDHDCYGSVLQHATGSKQHNIDLRERAQRMGLSLSEYGILDITTGKTEKFADETAFYQRQGLQYIPPEIREGSHEIELAEKGRLPQLVNLTDIKGDLHIHSDWSDGLASLAELARAAGERGYEYICITDHSQGLGIARGLNKERLLQQIQAIEALNQTLKGIRILTGMEVNIKADGTLDIEDEVLAGLDVVLASLHSGLNQSEEQITRRLISAIGNPHVDIIAHPTGRLLGEREPAALDMEAVFKAAEHCGTALEISSMPTRLDLKDTHIYQAREMGVKLVIDTDCHRLEQLDFLRFGVGTARRGWCQAGDILNTLSMEELKKQFKK